MPDESQMEEARESARDSVMSDFANDVRELTETVRTLNRELEELTAQNERRWKYSRIIIGGIIVVLLLNVGSVFAVRAVQQNIEQETENRAIGNCMAIETTREALRSMIGALREQAQEPVPEQITDPDLIELFQITRERRSRLLDEMDDVIDGIQCSTAPLRSQDLSDLVDQE